MDSTLETATKIGPNISVFHLGVTFSCGKEGKTSELIDKVKYASFLIICRYLRKRIKKSPQNLDCSMFSYPLEIGSFSTLP